ncbi:MAG: 50S ribosomal protein L3 [Christensenellaceae bacterium]|jgi:large subunit ribosomal protein L3|nr:50S ribosomal protein L3 [Christensenellaceae bacterium]
MNKAILGQKIGMSQIFASDGTVIPVTVVNAGPCLILQRKTVDKDGYDAVKVAFGEIKDQNVNKPNAGQFRQALSVEGAQKTSGPKYARHMREFRFDDYSNYEVGKSIKCDVFVKGDHVDVTGNTRGRGFTGTIQRWNTHCGPKAHGSGYHRGVGSLSANSTPSRVFKNKKMPGQYGNEQVTIQNLEIVRVDAPRNLLFVAGGIPGADGSLVVIKQTIKRVRKGSRWFKDPKSVAPTGKK